MGKGSTTKRLRRPKRRPRLQETDSLPLPGALSVFDNSQIDKLGTKDAFQLSMQVLARKRIDLVSLSRRRSFQ